MVGKGGERCPAKSLMGYRVPWGEWPQGALLGTSRGRVAETWRISGFYQTGQCNNVSFPLFPPPYGYHVKNRRAGCSPSPRDRVRQERVIRLVSRYWIGRRKRQHRKHIFWSRSFQYSIRVDFSLLLAEKCGLHINCFYSLWQRSILFIAFIANELYELSMSVFYVFNPGQL